MFILWHKSAPVSRGKLVEGRGRENGPLDHWAKGGPDVDSVSESLVDHLRKKPTQETYQGQETLAKKGAGLLPGANTGLWVGLSRGTAEKGCSGPMSRHWPSHVPCGTSFHKEKSQLPVAAHIRGHQGRAMTLFLKSGSPIPNPHPPPPWPWRSGKSQLTNSACEWKEKQGEEIGESSNTPPLYYQGIPNWNMY